MRQAKDPTYDATLLKQIPKSLRDYTIKQILQSSKERELLMKLLAENYAGQDLEYFEDAEEFKEVLNSAPSDVDAIMRKIKSKHFNNKYLFGANSPAGKEGQDKVYL